MAGIYIHIPFCKTRCIYCDFYSTTRSELKLQYIHALYTELKTRKGYLKEEPIETIYFGGGTPSQLAHEDFEQIFRTIKEVYGTEHAEEITLEANPDDLTENYLDGLREAGIDRLSIGIQSFDDGCLKLMNRRHTAAQAIGAVRAAQRAGFGNITADLIFGIPGFGGDSLKRSLDGVLSLGVQHISAYHLTIEPDTAFGRRAARGEFRAVDEEVSEEEFLTVHDTLTAAGFEHYEVSNYALPGFRARHNASYWHGTKYLGIGPAAHSFDGEERHWNASSVEKYIAGTPAGKEVLTRRDRFNEYVMTALRTAEGIDLEEAAARFGAKRLARMQEEAAPFLRSGTLRIVRGRMALPPEKFLVSDAVIGALFET